MKTEMTGLPPDEEDAARLLELSEEIIRDRSDPCQSVDGSGGAHRAPRRFPSDERGMRICVRTVDRIFMREEHVHSSSPKNSSPNLPGTCSFTSSVVNCGGAAYQGRTCAAWRGARAPRR